MNHDQIHYFVREEQGGKRLKVISRVGKSGTEEQRKLQRYDEDLYWKYKRKLTETEESP